MKKIYYAEGNKGLETDPKGSHHTELLDIIKVDNVAKVSIKSNYGREKVSMEDILKWNPNLIICSCTDKIGNGQTYNYIEKNKLWKKLEAVRKNRFYKIPNLPFDCFDRPPSVNRIIGLKWLANTIYPELYNYDLYKEFKEFYKLFYHYDLKEKEFYKILGGNL